MEHGFFILEPINFQEWPIMSEKRYDKEFKLYAVMMVVEDGRKVAEVARQLDLVHQTLHKWVEKYKEEQEDAFVGSGNKEELEKDKRIRDLEEEVAISFDCCAYFFLKTIGDNTQQPNEYVCNCKRS